jgi:hypothetical protein
LEARANPLGDSVDGSAFAGAVPALEDDADLQLLENDPSLKLHELDVQLGQLAFIVGQLYFAVLLFS